MTFGFACFFWAFAFFVAWTNQEFKGWVSIGAKITEVTQESGYYLKVLYTYDVNSIPFSNTVLLNRPMRKRALLKKYVPGATLAILVNPDHPNESVLGSPFAGLVVFLFGLGCLFFILPSP